jgi:hypothetical protein
MDNTMKSWMESVQTKKLRVVDGGSLVCKLKKKKKKNPSKTTTTAR